MQSLTEKTLHTQDGIKTISVHACDIRDLDIAVDIMTVSAFYRDYHAVEGTLLGALYSKNIDVYELSKAPEIDLRSQCNIWLSKETKSYAKFPIKRVGCIELTSYSEDHRDWRRREASMLASIQAYFKMLDIASIMGISIERIVLPVLGAGSQQVSADFIMTPLLSECIRFLKNNSAVKHIMIVTHGHRTAYKFAKTLDNSYSFQNEAAITKKIETENTKNQLAFISYSSKDKNIADNFCAKLESSGIKVWYAPRDIIAGDYAGRIVEAINRCTKFIGTKVPVTVKKCSQ